jgi:hypothetical protein
MMTLRLWHLLHGAPVSVEFRKLLRLDEREKATIKSQILTLCAQLFVLALMGLLLPATIGLSCIEKALQIATALARQHSSNRHDLIAVTPMGDAGLVVGIMQIYCRSATLAWGSLLKVCGFVALGIFLMFLIYGTNYTDSFNNALIFTLIAAAFFIDYMQSITWAMVIGVYAGLSGDPFKARVFAFVGYLSLQVLIYMGLLAALILSFVWLLARLNSIFLLLTITLTIFFVAREGAIFVLWMQIRQRLNDDIILIH